MNSAKGSDENGSAFNYTSEQFSAVVSGITFNGDPNMKIASQNAEKKRPIRFFATGVGLRFYGFGLIIPVIIWFITQFCFNALSDEVAIKLCYWLKFVWPDIYDNFVQILALGHKVEAQAYVLLVLVTFIYAAVVVVLVLDLYYRNRDRILNFESRDFIAFVVFGLLYFLRSTVYQVTDKFTGFGSFYIDKYGFWIFRYYILLYAIFATSQLCAVCAAKLIDMMKRDS